MNVFSPVSSDRSANSPVVAAVRGEAMMVAVGRAEEVTLDELTRLLSGGHHGTDNRSTTSRRAITREQSSQRSRSGSIVS